MDRFEKLDWLTETCGEEFLKDTFVNEVVRWMGERDFEEFYDHLCRMWEIARSPEELDERMGIVHHEEELEYVKGFR